MDQQPGLAECLREIFEHPLTALPVRVYSYNEDFEKLWNPDFPLADGNGAIERVIVVFDSVPESKEEQNGLNLADRVTAYDWIAWLALGKCAGFSVMLLDLASHRHPGSFGVQTLPLLLSKLPWVRLYKLAPPPGAPRVKAPPNNSDRRSPHGPDESAIVTLLLDYPDERGRLAAHLGRDGFSEFRLFCDLGLAGANLEIGLPPRDLSARPGDTSDTAGERIKELWVQSLTRAGGRHEVANLIGPLILADAMVSKGYRGADELWDELQKDKLVSALCWLLYSLDLSSKPDEKPHRSKDPETPSHFPDRDAFERFPKGKRERVRFLLVDDQARLGYARLLSLFLTGKQGEPWKSAETSWKYDDQKRVSIQAETNPDILISLLESATASKDEWKKLRVLGEEYFDVLFLDLRLFPESGGTQMSPEEKRFLERLTVMKGLTDSYREAAPAVACTPGSLDKRPKTPLELAFEAAEERLKGEAETPLQWTLLPLLLCEADPSLPIIIFSSTHQRDIIDALSTKPNVIISFAKPVLSGYRENAKDRVCKDLTEAVHRALELHEKRVVWEHFVGLQDWDPAHPRFSIHCDNASPAPYNLPKGGNPVRPRIAEKELQRILASHFREYLLHGRYFDLLSAPFELLEAALVPKEYVDGVRNDRPTVIFPDDDHLGYPVVTALKYIRNKKAHGHAGHDESGMWLEWNVRGQLVAVILLFLAEFIKRGDGGDPCPAVRDKWDKYCLQMAWILLKDLEKTELRGVSPANKKGYSVKVGIDPRCLTTNSRIDWADITMYTLAMGCREVARHHCPSGPAWRALEALIDSRLKPLDLGVAKLTELPGREGQTVKIETAGEPVVRHVRQSGFFGKAPTVGEVVVFKRDGEKGSPDEEWALCESWLPRVLKPPQQHP